MPSTQEWLSHANQCRSIAGRSEQYGDSALAAYLLEQAARMEELAAGVTDSASAATVIPYGRAGARPGLGDATVGRVTKIGTEPVLRRLAERLAAG